MATPFLTDFSTAAKLLSLVFFVLFVFRFSVGKKIANVLPTPFWIYFLPMVLNTMGFLPTASPVYNAIGVHVLPAALLLMLIGAPVKDLLKMGPHATLAMAIATLSMFFSAILVFWIFSDRLPSHGWQATGALLGTWIGGSANMLAVKEMLNLSDEGLAPVVIVDTFLSYAWLALLLAGVGFQRWFDAPFSQKIPLATGAALTEERAGEKAGPVFSISQKWKSLAKAGALVFLALLAVQPLIIMGKELTGAWGFLSGSGWTILLATTLAIGLALTSLRRAEQWGASGVGSFLLYLVLVTIGAKTDLVGTARNTGLFFVFGALILGVHGFVCLLCGRILKIPLFLLTTASQANVGGVISAPLVANLYRPGTAHLGVLMAVTGAVLGTYIGMLGGWICRWIG